MNKFIFNEEERRAYFLNFSNNNSKYECGKIGRSILGRDIHYYKIGSGKRHILAVGAHHAMEYITSAALYGFIDFLCENDARGNTCHGVNIAFLLQKFTYWIIPCLNPDGVELHLYGACENPLRERQIKMCGGEDFSEWQANARGVDLNHNYNAGFAEYKLIEMNEGISAGKTKFSGEYPESEPEVASIANFIRALNPSAVVSLHTQGREIFCKPDTEKIKRIAKRLSDLVGYTVSTPVGNAAYGGLVDYSGGVLEIPSFTVELGCGKNPLPESSLSEIAQDTKKLLVSLPTYL